MAFEEQMHRDGLFGPSAPQELVYDSGDPDRQPSNVIAVQKPFAEAGRLLPEDFFMNDGTHPGERGVALLVRLLARRGDTPGSGWSSMGDAQIKELMTFITPGYHDRYVFLDAVRPAYTFLEREAPYWRQYLIEVLIPHLVTKFGTIRNDRQKSRIRIRTYDDYAAAMGNVTSGRGN